MNLRDAMTDSMRGAILRWQGRLHAARILRAERQPDGRFARHLRILRDQLGLAETTYRPAPRDRRLTDEKGATS